MKRLNLFMLFLIIAQGVVLSIYAVEGKVEPYRPKEAVSEPKKPEDAYTMEERYKETLEEYNEGRLEQAKAEDSIASIDALIKKKKADLEAKKHGGPQIESDIAQLEAMKQAKEYLDQPSMQEMITAYKAELQAGLEGPTQPEQPTEEPKVTELAVPKEEQEKLPFGTELWNTFKTWVQEGRARVYDWLGNRQKVQEIRTDLDNVHTLLGDKNLVAKAQNKAELAKIQTIWSERLKLGTEALDAYKAALDKGVGDQAAIKAEAQEIIIDLMQLRQELKTFEAEEEKIKQVVDIDIAIEEILKDFGITDVDAKTLEQQAIEALTKELVASRQAIEKQLVDAQFEKKVLDPVELGKFKYQVDQLVGRDISALPLEEQGRINLALVEAYKRPSDELWQQLQSKDLSDRDRALVLDRFMKFNNDYINAEKRFGDWLESYIEKEGKAPTILPDQKALPQRFIESMKQRLEPVITKVILEKFASNEEYQQLTQLVKQFEDALAQVAVTPESLDAREYLLTEVYGRIANAIFRQEALRPTDQVVQVFVDANAKVGETSERLAADQAAIIVETPEGKLAVEVPAPPPPPAASPAPPAPSEQPQEKTDDEKKPETGETKTQPDDLLAAIRAGTQLRSADDRQLPAKKEEAADLTSLLTSAFAEKFRGVHDEKFEEVDDDEWD